MSFSVVFWPSRLQIEIPIIFKKSTMVMEKVLHGSCACLEISSMEI